MIRERGDEYLSRCNLWRERQNTTSFIAGAKPVDMLNQRVENTTNTERWLDNIRSVFPD